MKKASKKHNLVFKICEEGELLHAHVEFGCLEIPEIVTHKSQALALLSDLSDKINNFNEAKEIITKSDLPETEDEFKQILLEKIVGELGLDFTEEDLVDNYSPCSANQTLH